MKALVLGGSGFIGSHVVDVLLARGHFVRVLDRQYERFRRPLSGVEYNIGNFSDESMLAEVLTGIDAVFHLVSTTFPGTANLNPRADVRDNLIGTLNVLGVITELQIRRLVFLSSGGTVYGVPDHVPIPETHPLRPINSYGIVKVAIEQYLEMYRQQAKISSLVVRASNPYGPRQAHSGVQGVISTFLKRVRDGQPIEIWGDGAVVRDFLHVADLAEFCVAAAETDVAGTFNVGSGEGHSLNDVIEIIGKITGVDVVPQYKPGRPVDVPRNILDTARAREMFGWRPTITLDDGVRQTWTWMQDSERS